MPLLGLILNLLISGVILSLGFLVLFKKRGITNLSFFSFTLFFSFWLVFNFLENFTGSLSLAKMLLIIDFVLAPFFIYSLFFFLINFPYPTKSFLSRLEWKFILFLPVVALSGLVLSGQIVKEVGFSGDRLVFANGPAFPWYAAMVFVYVLAGLALLVRRYWRTKGRVKMQIGYVLLSFLILLFTLGFINLFLQNFISKDFFQLTNATSIIFVVFTAYAMVKHRLMDIKIIIREPAVYFLSIWTALAADLFLLTLANKLSFIWELAADCLIIVFSLISFPWIKKFFYFLANKYFFYTLYDTRKVVSEVSEQLTATLDSERICDFVFRTIKKIFQAKVFCVLKYEKKTGRYVVFFKKNLNLDAGQRFSAGERIWKEYLVSGQVFTKDDLRERRDNEKKGSLDRFIGQYGEVSMPLVANNQVIGLIVLGPKESGDMYTEGDLKLLYIIGSQVASAMENADLYAKITLLNRSLERKVFQQTKEIKAKAEELEVKNKNLKKLLEIKNEFLRLVNHQLNTPISIIKNSIFMVRKGSFSQEKGLSFIDEGVKRMEGVINDFWKAFYFEGEGVKMNFRKTDLKEIVERLVNEANNLDIVKNKDLKLKVGNVSALPPVKSDPVQISQAVSNLLDNAITYTPSGSVSFSFERYGNDFVKVHIADTGYGIDKKDAAVLFEKFSRGERAKKYRPGGSGLGLYIAKKVIEASGGRLKLEKSAVDKGSTFSFTLPIWK